MISVKKTLADAVRFGNTVYRQLPDDAARDDFGDLWLSLERKVVALEVAGDDQAIDALIARWRRTVEARFLEVAR